MSVNFTPTKGDYTELKPFRFWCQKILPLVYDDSLSYYELLCKVVDYLNKTMEDVDTLNTDVENVFEAYDELQTYVNNYFDNLNVQNEINNKLDAMASDGTLDNLVSPYVPPIVTAWLNEHVDPATGYVIDDSLTIEGTAADAKATGDAINYLDEYTQVIKGGNEFHFEWEQGNLTLSTGAEETATYAIRTGLLKFTGHCVITPYYNNSGTRTDILYYNDDGTFANKYEANIRNPFTIGDATGRNIRIRIINTNMTSVTPSDGANVKGNFVHLYSTPELSERIDLNSFDINGLITGEYQFEWESGNLALSTGAEEYAIWCLRTYMTKFKQPVIVHPYIANGYSNYILKYNLSGVFQSYAFFDKDYMVDDANALYRFKLMRVDLNSIDFSVSKNVYYTGETVSGLNGKKIVCFGDSITGNFRPPQNYESTIAELSGATVYDAGFGGCTMSDAEGIRYQYAMCNLADSIATGSWSYQEESGIEIDYAVVNSAGTAYNASEVDYVPSKLAMLQTIDWSKIDYIVIAFGTNDWAYGNLIDNANNLYDKSTYLGAFRYSVERILTAYPNIKIVPVTPCWRWWDTGTGSGAYGDSDTTPNHSTQLKLSQYADGLKEVATEKYHLEVCDLYYNSGFNKFNRYSYFFTNDGTHPKPDGIKVIGNRIYNTLDKLS